MDTHLKERLVGAAVLIAAGVILIPEMLSGPGTVPPEEADPAQVADSGVRTYTIDLANRGAAQREPAAEAEEPAAVVETPVPPPESEPVDPPGEPAPTSRVAAEAIPEPASRPQPVVAPPAPAPERATEPAPANRNLPWVVQVGSFASQATANRLRGELEQRGYPSFVVPFKTATQTLYRVRIGPMQERSAAEAAVRKLKAEGTAATVVANS